MIEIKPLFGGWREADKNTARDFVIFLIQNSTAIHRNHINEYINSNKIRGITVEELLKEE